MSASYGGRNQYSFWKPSGLLGTLLPVECLYSWWTVQSHWVFATARVMVKFASVKDKPQPIRDHRVSTWELRCDKINLSQQVSICRQNKSHSAPWAAQYQYYDKKFVTTYRFGFLRQFLTKLVGYMVNDQWTILLEWDKVLAYHSTNQNRPIFLESCLNILWW